MCNILHARHLAMAPLLIVVLHSGRSVEPAKNGGREGHASREGWGQAVCLVEACKIWGPILLLVKEAGGACLLQGRWGLVSSVDGCQLWSVVLLGRGVSASHKGWEDRASQRGGWCLPVVGLVGPHKAITIGCAGRLLAQCLGMGGLHSMHVTPSLYCLVVE